MTKPSPFNLLSLRVTLGIVLTCAVLSAQPPSPAQQQAWLSCLEGSDWILKADALNQLGRHQVKPAATPVAKLLETESSSYIKARALVALAAIDPPRALKPALALLESRDAALRLAAVEALGVLADPAAKEAVTRAVNDSDPAVQRAAIRTYARLHGKSAAPLLINRLRAEDPRIASDAAEAIGLTDPVVARRELVAALDRPHEALRLAAVRALADCRGPEVVGPLLERLARDESSAVREAALRSLQRLDAATLELGVTGALQGDPAHRAAAMSVIRAVPDPRFAAATVRLAKDPATPIPVLLDALAVLGVLGGREAQWVIRQHATHDQPAVRARAVHVLEPADDAAWWLLLRQRLADEDAAVRQAAFALLSRVDASRAPEGVLGLLQAPLQSKDSATVATALDAIGPHVGRLKPEALQQALQPVLTGSHDALRRQASELLTPLLNDQQLRSLLHLQGYITGWRVVRGFPGGDNLRGVDMVFPPEQGIDLDAAYRVEGSEEPLRWQIQEVNSPEGTLWLEPGWDQADNQVAYLVCELQSSRDQVIALRPEADDVAVFWMNGKPLGKAVYGQRDAIKGTLTAGRNLLLVKLVNERGPWGLAVRLTDADGQALSQVAADVRP